LSEPRLISPMLDNFMMGGPISEHHGVCCCPAMENETNDRYIVKVISVPATSSQMDALLLSGAFSDEAAALDYFRELANGVIKEVDVLEKLAELEGFIPFTGCQLEMMESGKGFEVYLLSPYKRSLLKHFKRHSFTHLDALNLGLDLCASLSVCRRSGYIYVDLKPSNIFVTDQRLFRIGDLGFINLDSLKYASLPDKYLSIYTPPEIRDAFSALNSTMDIYAAGLILYQTYNNGQLPFNDDVQPGDKLPAPLYADYEMSEIILKACASNPEERWQDPMEMGQAIVSYMQRNGASDTPIVPMPVQEEVAEPPKFEADVLENAEVLVEEVTDETDITEEVLEDTEDAIENLSVLEDESPEEDELEEIEELVADYEAITDEVSEMLTQADELANLAVPEPVVVPEHVDVPMPEPVPEEEPVSEDEESEDEQNELEEVQSAELDEELEFDEPSPVSVPAKNHHWLRNAIIALIIIALIAGGVYFYKNYYLLPIEFIAVEGNEDSLTVLVTTNIDESLLQVVCSDTYGNQIPAPVINGKAEFTGLVPNTAYSIKVVANGFHRLTGKATTAYSTPVQSNIVQFDAISGATEDSAILSFTVEGPSCDQWSVLYSAEGEEERSATFTEAHMVTLTNLTVGKEYIFRLVPKESLYLTGQSEIKFTPVKLIRAENLHVTSCINSTLTAKWSSPEGANVSGWSVRCYNESYSQTIVTTDTLATFKNLDHTAEFDVEVKAVGMSVSEKVTVPANSITASNFNVDTTDPTKLTLSWEPSQAISDDGWILRYSIVGIGNEETISCNSNTATISSLMPKATYRIQLEDIKGTVLLGSKTEITTGDAVDFNEDIDGFTAKREDLKFYMCKTPDHPNWGRYNLTDDDYTTTFPVGQSASFLVRSQKDYPSSSKNVTTMFVIRDQSGIPVLTAQQTKPWRDMWKSYNCKLEIPVMPTEVGTYVIEVYFNGGLANVETFTIQ